MEDHTLLIFFEKSCHDMLFIMMYVFFHRLSLLCMKGQQTNKSDICTSSTDNR